MPVISRGKAIITVVAMALSSKTKIAVAVEEAVIEFLIVVSNHALNSALELANH